jgi:hypothetical protein
MGVELIQHNKTLKDAISTASSTAALENTSMRAMIRKRTTKISNEIRNINKQNTTLLQTLRRSRDTWKHHSSQTDAQSEGSQRSLENVIGSVAEMRTTTIFSATNIQMMTDVMRRELQSTLEPIVEQLFTESANRNEAILDRLADVIHSMACEVGQGVHKMDSNRHDGDCSHRRKDDRLENFHAVKEPSLTCLVRDVSCEYRTPVASQFSYMVSKFRQSWTFRWRIGVLKITLCTTTNRTSGSINCEIRTELIFCFTPSQVLIQLPGIETLHKFGPDERGYYQIVPEICVFPVVHGTHPIFDAIWYGNLVQIQELLATERKALRMRTEDGSTLLHVSILLISFPVIFFALPSWSNVRVHCSGSQCALVRIDVGKLSCFSCFRPHCTSRSRTSHERHGRIVVIVAKLLF